ncbi:MULTISPECIES: hypothetical protein [Alphaproteobacteria]|uniref:RDD family protein n=2 Tax=Alphaproteobacteria TaxID=28211 RepID=A0A512HD09_9HYPH|nr:MULTISPECIES: hypothetical protein [Alphaproteobacteria]GEO83333.1 hypothetical protein RNA01_02650 [Ciceribacter naphthalenivorans]GLR20273.1 hypothetical protein GCM10007920_00570 [Ciceribacter naphthalenivorans]GLT03129.1 hypothetical protein GCM10007926_00570 [Sphingomonas psychrolutea]
MTETNSDKGPASWRIILAFVLDLFSAFFVLGFAVASVAGGRTEEGFQLNGMPAFVLFALIIAYFVVFNRYLGGTIWKRILKAQR